MNINNLISNAAIKLEHGQLDEAEIDLKKIFKKQPKHADTNHLLGLIAAHRKQFSRAISFLNIAIKREPKNEQFLNNLALALLNNEQPEKALATFKQVTALNPFHIGAHYNSSNISQDLGDLDAALASCETVIQLNPSIANTHNNCAVILARLNRMEEALTSCEQAIKINPQYAAAHYNRGNALKELGRLDDALKSYDMAIKYKPDDASAHSNRGNVLFSLERSEAAIEAFKTAIKISPELPEVNNNLGNALLKLKRTDEAISALEKELQGNPKSTSAKYVLATLGRSDAPQQSPEEYIARLFNDCADQFDNRLVDKLGYDAPQQMYNAAKQTISTSTHKLDILDLGCGTGLCGVAFTEFANTLVGVDLAERMIKKSRERNIYTDLIKGDIYHTLKHDIRKYDLILSGDVFIYIGKLDNVFKYAAHRLNDNGLFIFSIEVDEAVEDFTLRTTGRYAQSSRYIQNLSRNNNLEEISCHSGVLRYEHNKPIAGSVFVLRLQS